MEHSETVKYMSIVIAVEAGNAWSQCLAISHVEWFEGLAHR